MRAVMFGSVLFSGKCMKRLIRGWPGFELVGVVTKKSSTFHSDFLSLEPMARAHGIPSFYSMGNAEEEAALAEWIGGLQPDLIFVLGWSHLLSHAILQQARVGCIGFHPTMLPKNRGRHPLIWTLALGLSEAGATYFWLDAEADNGDIISQRVIPVTERDDAASLYEKVERSAVCQLDEFVPVIVAGGRPGTPQLSDGASVWRKRGPRDGEIDWRMSARSIRNLVRALTRPYSGAQVLFRGRRFPVWRVELSQGGVERDEPGKILLVNGNKFVVKCGEGAVEVLEHEIDPAPDCGDYL